MYFYFNSFCVRPRFYDVPLYLHMHICTHVSDRHAIVYIMQINFAEVTVLQEQNMLNVHHMLSFVCELFKWSNTSTLILSYRRLTDLRAWMYLGWAPVYRCNHTSWVAVVTSTDRPKSVRNRCVIELFVALCCHFALLTFLLVKRLLSYDWVRSPPFLCRLWSIAAHRDHFVRRLSVCASVCPIVTLPLT